RMVLLEAVHITVAATAAGLVLGIVYGWIAAQSLLGSVPVLPDFEPAGLVHPVVPWIPVAVIVAATALLTVIAAVAPTRLATRVVPVEALAADWASDVPPAGRAGPRDVVAGAGAQRCRGSCHRHGDGIRPQIGWTDAVAVRSVVLPGPRRMGCGGSR